MGQANHATLREIWDRRLPTIGGWCALPSPTAIEILGQAGFDWIVLDMQHGLISTSDLTTMMPALAATGVPGIVRVPWNEPSVIMKSLDAGAAGVIVPMVNSADEASAAVRSCRYPPDGTRSWGPIRASLYVDGYSPERANRDSICIVMVETIEAVQNVERILDVPGIDAIFVGPSDLAASAGFAPSPAPIESEHRRLIHTVLSATQDRNVVAGIACGSAELLRRWRSDGFLMLAAPSELTLMQAGAESLLRESA